MIFEPVSYEHAARLIGRRPWDVSRDAGLLAAAHDSAIRTYRCTTCVVGLDIYNVEIEAYGCVIREPPGHEVPKAGPPPFESPERLLALDLDPGRDGRFPLLLEAAARIAERHPGVRVRIPIVGPFTIACHLLGMENALCRMAEDPGPLSGALLHLAGNQVRLARHALNRGFGLSVFDSAVAPPLLSPVAFAEWVLPALERVFHALPGAAARDTQLIIGGDTAPILDAILSLDPAYIICPVETDQAAFMRRLADASETVVRINMNPSVFLAGNREPAKAETGRVLELARSYPRATIGSLLPFDADTQLVLEIAEWLADGKPGN